MQQTKLIVMTVVVRNEMIFGDAKRHGESAENLQLRFMADLNRHSILYVRFTH